MSKKDSVDIYSQSNHKRKKGKGGKVALIIIIVLLVLILAAAAWVWFFNRDLIADYLPQQETEPTTVEATTIQATTAEPTVEETVAAEIEVPDVSSGKAQDAYSKLNSVGLRYTVVREYSTEVKAENVISQEPEPGTVLKQNETVTLHISKGIDHPPDEPTAPTSATDPSKKSDDKKQPAGKYILDDSSKRIIDRSELYSLDTNELTLALNEIYARHGRKFNSPEIQAYFNKQSWYKGTISPSDFDDSMLSSVERANTATILSVLKER